MNFLKIPYMQEFQSFSIKINLCFNSIFLNGFFLEAEVRREGSEPTLAGYWNPKLLYGGGGEVSRAQLPPRTTMAGSWIQTHKPGDKPGHWDTGLGFKPRGQTPNPSMGLLQPLVELTRKRKAPRGQTPTPPWMGPLQPPAELTRKGKAARHSTAHTAEKSPLLPNLRSCSSKHCTPQHTVSSLKETEPSTLTGHFQKNHVGHSH